MDTYFASPQRATKEALAAEIAFVSKHPLTSGLLHSIGGLLAIVNKNRQIVAINDSLLTMLGLDDSRQALGLRPGEALQCIHAYDEPAGCGTTKVCDTCGAAIAMVSSLCQEKPDEKICALSANRGGKTIDMALLVRCTPIIIDQEKFIVLLLQDITRQQQRAALERTFFHDINNILSILVGTSELLDRKTPSTYSNIIRKTSVRLAQEVAIQRCLLQSDACHYQPMWHNFTTSQIMEELQLFFINHPLAHGKQLKLAKRFPVLPVATDLSLLLRVLCNMIINAFEATAENGVVKVWLEHEGECLSFYVWNAQEIPPSVTNRVFQRNFSTKEQAGRGVGTYSMKLFGEEILGGQVSFTTSEKEGTTFKFAHPIYMGSA